MDASQLKQLIITELCNIAPDVEPGSVPDNEDLREALDLDSMDFLRLVAAVTKRTGLAIPEADYRQVLTLANMIKYLQAQSAT